MNFAFDTLHFRAGSGGPARVTEELIAALNASGDSVYTIGPEHPEPSRSKLLPALVRRAVFGIRFPHSGHSGKPVHIAGEIWPVIVPEAAQVILLHDTFALDRRDWAKPVERYLQKRRIGWAKQHADLVVTPSEEVKHRLLDLVPRLRNRIAVIPWGISQVFKDAAAPATRGEPYWIASGDMTPRKGLGDLLSWYADRSRPPRLLLTGRIPSAALPSGVESTGTLGLSELARLIAGARAYLSFSFDEGFGLAIAEAAATGTPVVARSFPGGENRFPEGIHWFKAPSEAGTALQQALAGPRTPPSWARDLSWSRTADQLREAVFRIR